MGMQRNPNAGKFVKPEGYKDLGWQVGISNVDFLKCFTAGHMDMRSEYAVKEFDNSLFLHRCTDVVRICHTCKHVWHTDMSD